MYITVPEAGMGRALAGVERVRKATIEDVAAMAALEMEVSGISRDEDYLRVATQALFGQAVIIEVDHTDEQFFHPITRRKG